MDCGCKPDYSFVGHGEDTTAVDFCAMHAAAPEMLKALERVAEDINVYPYDPLTGTPTMQEVDEAILRTKGQEVSITGGED